MLLVEILEQSDDGGWIDPEGQMCGTFNSRRESHASVLPMVLTPEEMDNYGGAGDEDFDDNLIDYAVSLGYKMFVIEHRAGTLWIRSEWDSLSKAQQKTAAGIARERELKIKIG